MAINPNTNFTAGAVLTADQQNRFPRGIMALAKATANQALGAEAVTITAPAFTAVANRYYRITYFEPRVPVAGSSNTTTLRIRNTNASGTIRGGAQFFNAGSNLDSPFTVVAYATFAAGSQTIVGTIAALGGNATRTADLPALIMVEDMGPA
jgi:hypothetical protein